MQAIKDAFAQLVYVDMTEKNELDENKQKKKKVSCTYYIKFVKGNKKKFSMSLGNVEIKCCTIKK